MEFEWDLEKAASNLAKHGVSFSEAATVLRDSLSVTFYDPDHSEEEDRFITLGTSLEGRFLILSHVDRGEKVHIISARLATRRERKLYEEGEHERGG